MDDNDRFDTQWTVAANAAYEQCATEFLEALQRHVSQILGRKGRQVEWGQYFESADELRKAAVAFDNAEFDWCGAFPLRIHADQEDEEDEEDDAPPASNSVLTALGRWDFRITDADAVVAAGRDAYRRAWPDATPEDALERVQGPESAASEITHADGWSALSLTSGLLLGRSVHQFMTHDRFDDGEWEEDPFRIAED